MRFGRILLIILFLSIKLLIIPSNANESGLKIELVKLENTSQFLKNWPTRLVDRKKLRSREYWDDEDDRDDFYKPIHYWFGPIHGAYCKAIKLTGRIAFGDAERLKAFLEKTTERNLRNSELVKSLKPHCFIPGSRSASLDPSAVDVLVLDFRGGNLSEALKIIQILPPMTTVVPKGGRCISACALIFLSGRYLIDNWGSYPSNSNVSRWMHVDSDVGFHAPQPKFGRILHTQNENLKDLNDIYMFSFDQAIELSKLLTTDVDESVLDKVANVKNISEYTMIDSIEEAWRFNIDLFGYQYGVGRDKLDQLTAKAALNVCRNVWDFHTKPVETDFYEVNAGFSGALDPKLSELKGDLEAQTLESRTHARMYGSQPVLFFLRKLGSIIIYEDYQHARFPQLRKCAVRYLGGKGKKDRHYTVSIEGHRPTNKAIRVPAWYAYEGNLPLKLTEYEK